WGVTLETPCMLLYLSFPVTMFWVSNQAGYFEEHVVRRKVGARTPGPLPRGRGGEGRVPGARDKWTCRDIIMVPSHHRRGHVGDSRDMWTRPDIITVT
uniref:Uncharacterized protein n=1 Tax=Dromaius novaehollandiae TaxID=8790 RepID=A0A8C4KPS3_DRONO